jgi:hypothetical protein
MVHSLIVLIKPGQSMPVSGLERLRSPDKIGPDIRRTSHFILVNLTYLSGLLSLSASEASSGVTLLFLYNDNVLIQY